MIVCNYDKAVFTCWARPCPALRGLFVENFVTPELPVYRPFNPLTRNSAIGRKAARYAPVASKPRSMHQHQAFFPSIWFPAGHSTIYLDAQVDHNGGGTPINSDPPVLYIDSLECARLLQPRTRLAPLSPDLALIKIKSK